ncbi:hypothetical protein Dsin_022750 [Dipteronia sinensis]|uniref:Reverse transcriptase domain-containing protein n=1 Tax=Dipteronia sinensis TaxID=43782 RepID=A0AAE0A242_9ROSI|nr:hypothetical protein Dsin_022750 [Dipteronia sinensis]
MIILSWNVRGLGRGEKRRAVRDLVMRHKPMMLFIQESKLKTLDSRTITSLGGSLLIKDVGVEADGSAEGLISLWNENLFQVHSCITNKRCIIVAGEVVSSKKTVAFCNVYASNIEIERKSLWNFIELSQGSLTVLWCIRGDFNTILDPSERSGGLCNMGSIRSFNNFMLRTQVIDLPAQGSAFTWSNCRENPSSARLDRFLISPIILSWFPKLVQRNLQYSLFDHCAIYLGEPRVDWGPCPFHFYNGWLEDKEMMKDAREGWKECKVVGSQGFKLFSKVKAAKRRMKAWQLVKRKNGYSFKVLEDKLVRVEVKVSLDGWTPSLRDERLKIISEMWKWLHSEEVQWRQKSHLKWLLEGDRNTHFFHCVASSRRRMNFIGDIIFDGVQLSDPLEVRKGVLNHFRNQYRKGLGTRPRIRDFPMNRISHTQENELEEEFTQEEVWEAISSCDGNKAPGPDGLNLMFIKNNWDVIRDDFLSFLKDFHRDGEIVMHLNRTFIALIPKISKPERITDFRPISLVGAMYKVLSKVLANRLKKVMNSIIGDAQMAFIKQRQIIDSYVVANEIINQWMKDSVGGILVKLDFEKAYDTVDHAFLDVTLENMGFGSKWRS